MTLPKDEKGRVYRDGAHDEHVRPKTPDPRKGGGLGVAEESDYLVRIPLPTLGSFSMLRVMKYCCATEMMLLTTQ
ncbi:hypothetical protein HaloA020_11810 [Halomonas sp. A020]|nr:hypothetical protein HaloA020_11810 [Halomonas sp. A020]